MQEVIEDIAAAFRLMAFGFMYLAVCAGAGLGFIGVLALLSYLLGGI